ncbi:MAG: transporter substrate-binding domain-containing protein, partial [Actinomycetota bacterium]|nr:transporter substrate-binding domain-containing protein [Actinomycetota bacterium]
MRRKYVRLLGAAAVITAVAGGCADEDDDAEEVTEETGEETDGTDGETEDDAGGGGGGVLAAVQDADVLRCGSRLDLPGFALAGEEGDPEGFDVDFCRAMAAGLLGDAEKVELVDVSTDDRLTALAAGNFDVLVRNTTFTATRDGGDNATFLQPNYYDGQRMMVAADSGIESVEDMDGTSVCVASG